MDIKDYAQMMSYLTRPKDVFPEPRPMAQGGRIPFDNGGDTSPVYNEKTGHIYKKGNRFGEFYSKTPPKNQFTAVKPLRSLEELQLVIDEAPLLEIDGKFHWIVYVCNKESDWKWSESYLKMYESDVSFRDVLKNLEIFAINTKRILPIESKKTPYKILREVKNNFNH